MIDKQHLLQKASIIGSLSQQMRIGKLIDNVAESDRIFSFVFRNHLRFSLDCERAICMM